MHSIYQRHSNFIKGEANTLIEFTVYSHKFNSCTVLVPSRFTHAIQSQQVKDNLKEWSKRQELAIKSEEFDPNSPAPLRA